MLGIVAAITLASPLVLSLSVNATDRLPFGRSWGKAYRAGLRATTLSLDWNRIETSPGKFDLTLPKIADAFYPASGVSIGLVLRELNTNRDERPTDLRDLSFDDPRLFARWKDMAIAVLDAMPHAKFSWIAVGNEVDASLSPESAKHTAYVKFLRDAIHYLHTRRPGIPVGTPLTYEGIKRSPGAWQSILATGDVAMVNYYLQGSAKVNASQTVHTDLAAMRNFAGKRTLLVTEVGCPSGAGAGGSESAQAEFFRCFFRELPGVRVNYANVVWMVDVGETKASEIAGLYGTQDGAFRDFLGTLGLCRADGTPKPAWDVIERRLAPNR